METYTYKGISDGKYVEGDIEAVNPDEASFKLKEQKIIITNLIRSSKKKQTEKKEKKKSGKSLFGKKKAKVEDVLIFSKQFATMVKAGLPILQVLAMLRDQLESPAMKEVVEDIRKSLEGGVTLSTCFGKFPELFDNVYINLIKAGEASGKLDVFLLKIVESLEKKEAIKKKIKGALMYPGIMFTVAITVSAFMLIKVVPVFAKMYDGMGIELPKATATIMAMSDFLRGTGGMVLLFGGIGGFIAFRYLNTPNPPVKDNNKIKPPLPLKKSLIAMIVAVAAGSSIPIPSYILANTGTTLTNMNALTVIATVNMMLGYIKADLIFFLIFSFFSRDSTILSKNTSNLPLASPALIKLM